MYLKSLELQGFKSFPDKTKLRFDEGTTVIVGPNGSGKSNLSDAMRWVLGEMSSKSLRGGKMEDFIFAGTTTRRPMGFAEVSVTFDNTSETDRLACPYDEVKVTRRYYRSGDSEYALNGRPTRLKDIYELFMDTGVGRDGYSIIGQGRIGELISKKSEERRGVFEEAAGIAKYRFRKNDAERKLKSADENLERALDVFGELDARIGPMKEEAERAQKAIALLNERKELDVRIWLYDTEKKREEVAAAEELFDRAKQDLSDADEAMQALQLQNDRLLELSRNSKSAAEELHKEISAISSTIHSLESELRVSETRIRHTGELLENARAALRTTVEERAAEEHKTVERAKHTEALRERLRTEEERKKTVENERDGQKDRAARAETALGEMLDALNDCESALNDAKLRLSLIENAQKNGEDRKGVIEGEIGQYRKAVESLNERYRAIKAQADTYERLLTDSTAAVDDADRGLAELQTRRNHTQDALSAARYDAGAIEERIRTIRAMDEQLEGYAGSVRFVMRQYDEGRIRYRDGRPCGKIYGPLSKVITVEDAYVTAIETALGANLGYIVTENEDTAKAAMASLKAAKAGRTTFLPVSSMQPHHSTPELERGKTCRGFIATASDLVTTDARFGNIISNLLGRILIFDTIESASEAAKACRYRVKLVTLDGQVINAGGSFTGGSTRTEGTMLGRASQIRKLEEELKQKEERVGKISDDLSKITKEIDALTSKRNAASDKCKVAEMLRNAELRKADQIETERSGQETLLKRLEDDLSGIEIHRTQAEEDLTSLNAEIKALNTRIEEIRAIRAEKDVERNEAIDARTALEETLLEITLTVRDTEREIETDLERDRESAERIETLTARATEENEKIATHEQTIRDLETRVEENRKETVEAQTALDALNAKYTDNSANSAEYESRLTQIGARIRAKTEEKEELFRAYTRVESRVNALHEEQDKLNTHLWDEYELTRADAVALGYPALEASERAAAVTRCNSCRNKLRALGHVDLGAFEKYKAEKERYDVMKAQIEDLQKSKAEILKLLDELTRDMKTAFETSFAEINTHFKRIFSELFGGGKAELALSEPDNPLESGIEIKAAPPGKVVANLLQLSGGEQAFTAVALLFAILSVNPTPFCILDEIEAALDEANVQRFAQYVKRYEGTQFIIITHRRGTMEAADNLYGVTMPERGISEVLKLSTEDIERYKEETPA